MRKVCCVLTARASYSRIRSALLEIQKYPALELQLIVAASALLERYGDIRGVLHADGLPIARELYSVVGGENLVSMPKTIGLLSIELASAFHDLTPDVVMTVADRHETLATAAAASYMNIPLVHVQGGEVTGSIDDKVRNAITQLADVHFVATETAALRVSRMRNDSANVHVTGCPSIDLARQASNTRQHPHPEGGVGAVLSYSEPYIVVLQHPVTTEVLDARDQAKETLRAVDQAGLTAAWFWPNVDAGSDATAGIIRGYREKNKPKKIRFYKSMPPLEFLRFLYGASCIVGNSSVGIRECSYLGVRAVNIGSRQEGRERAHNVVDVPYQAPLIKGAIMRQVARDKAAPSLLYGDGHAGEQIAKLLAREREVKAA